ncbi:MAG TPA: hypothetical protein VI322_00820 [Candidatus Saccharimonadia bacterium]
MSIKELSHLKLAVVTFVTTYLAIVACAVIVNLGLVYQPTRSPAPKPSCHNLDGGAPDTSKAPSLHQTIVCEGYAEQYVPPAEISWDVVHWRFEPYIGVAPSELPHVYVPLDVLAAVIILTMLLRYNGARRLTRPLTTRWLLGSLAAAYLVYGLSLILLNQASFVFPPNGLVAGCGQHGYDEACPATGFSYDGPTAFFLAPIWQIMTTPSELDTAVVRTYYPVDLVIAAFIVIMALKPNSLDGLAINRHASKPRQEDRRS